MTAATLPRMHGLEVVGAEGAAATGDTAADLAVVELELRHGQALFGFVRRQGLISLATSE